jgi:hypothetical protein
MVVKVIMGEPEQLQLEVEGPSLERGAAAAGLQPEVIPPPSFAQSQYGELQLPPYGNSDSTGISPVPPIHPATRHLTNNKQHTHPASDMPKCLTLPALIKSLTSPATSSITGLGAGRASAARRPA